MAMVVRTDIPILLDSIICHAWQRTLETYLSYNRAKNLAKSQQPALLQQTWRGNGEVPVVRLIAKAPDTLTSVQKLVRLKCRHNHLFLASDFCCYSFMGSSQSHCFLGVCEVGI